MKVLKTQGSICLYRVLALARRNTEIDVVTISERSAFKTIAKTVKHGMRCQQSKHTASVHWRRYVCIIVVLRLLMRTMFSGKR